jgi:hypothetical protein
MRYGDLIHLERRWRGETPEAAQAEAVKFGNGAWC